MQIERKVLRTEVTNVKYLLCKIGPRFYEDARILNKETFEWEDDNNDNPKIPCYNSKTDCWEPIINIDTGIIINWEQGVEAKIHYKSCDDNEITVTDEYDEIYYEYQGYVPKILSPVEEGWGDYVIFHVLPNGQIENWKSELIYELFDRQNFNK